MLFHGYKILTIFLNIFENLVFTSLKILIEIRKPKDFAEWVYFPEFSIEYYMHNKHTNLSKTLVNLYYFTAKYKGHKDFSLIYKKYCQWVVTWKVNAPILVVVAIILELALGHNSLVFWSLAMLLAHPYRLSMNAITQ